MDIKLHRQQSVAFQTTATEVLYGGAAGGGKALAITTPLPTPSGWTTMGEVSEGDQLLDEQGKPCHVVACTEVMYDRPCYRVTFDDGAEIIADAEHQWWTFDQVEVSALLRRDPEWQARRRASRPPRGIGRRPDLALLNSSRMTVTLPPSVGGIRTTAEIAGSLRCGAVGRVNHRVPVSAPLELPAADLPIDPWVLGAWLGDGSTGQAAFTTADEWMVDRFRAIGYPMTKWSGRYAWGIGGGFQRQLRALGVLGRKHIPAAYHRASVDQRLALLQGIVDTDGHITPRGACEICLANESLLNDVVELVIGLGHRVTIREKATRCQTGAIGRAWRIKFMPICAVATLPAKAARLRMAERATTRNRYIVWCDPVASVPVRCVMVDSPRSLYLAGRAMIPTHNSHLMRAAAIAWCILVPGLQVYLFRRTFPDLWKNHMEGPSSFPALLADWIADGHARINYGEKQVIFTNGSKIHLCHCQHEQDVLSYQGAEIHVLLMDELTHFADSQYRFLRGRCRVGALTLPAGQQGRFPRVLAGANPGGPGHTWVKAAFIDPAPALDLVPQAPDEGGMIRQFIPAKLADNPTMTESDPNYADRLAGLGRPELVRAMLDGDWDIVAGAMFSDVWAGVVVPYRMPPASWRLFRAFDWGAAKPFSIGWYAECDGTAASDGWCPKKGSLFRFAEWYGASKPNEGLRMNDADVARGVLSREQALGIQGRVSAGPADSAIFAAQNGDSIADVHARLGVRWLPADKGPGSRVAGWSHLRRLMASAGKYPLMEEPGLFIADTCRHAVRTMPALPCDPRKPEDVDSDAEDHAADEIRYACSMPLRRAGGVALP